tara:strand:- start:88 stop:249 length:162 start_codon:yes stop_codon:yes gene_type:complete
MTSLETFKEILAECQVEAPDETLEVFRDLVDMQADLILDQWLKAKKESTKGVK